MVRTFALAIAVIASLFVLPNVASAMGGYCEELRLACEHKDSLGEQGSGNCEKYRATCERRVSCGRLRYYCLHKEAYGAQGQGFCQTYRETCR